MRMFRICIVMAGLAIGAASTSSVFAQAASGSLYTCSMHPGVVEGKAGSCPVCSMTLKPRPMTADEQGIADFFSAYDAAFVAKDLAKLETMYTADTTVFEGGGVNNGWDDYRDHHLGPELKSFMDLRFAHSDVVPHLVGADAAFVTAEYTLHAKVGDRLSDGGGLATYQLVRQSGAWKIKHTHTSAKRR